MPPSCVLILSVAFFLSLAGRCLAQSPELCSALLPDGLYVLEPGSAFGLLSVCNASIPSGNIYLIRSGDSTFQPLLLSGILNNQFIHTAVIPSDMSEYGYGFRAVVASDDSSISSPLVTTQTFAIVDPAVWAAAIGIPLIGAAYDIIEPPTETTQIIGQIPPWTSSGENRVVWSAWPKSVQWKSISIFLYNSVDLSQAAVNLSSGGVQTGSAIGGLFYYYFTSPGGLPVGDSYQVVFTPFPENSSVVLAVSEPFTIANSPEPLPTVSPLLSGLALQTTIVTTLPTPTSFPNSAPGYSPNSASSCLDFTALVALMSGLCLLSGILS